MGLINSGLPVVIFRPDTMDLFSTLSPESRNICTVGAHNGVLIADNLCENIVSVSQLTDLGYQVCSNLRRGLYIILQQPGCAPVCPWMLCCWYRPFITLVAPLQRLTSLPCFISALGIIPPKCFVRQSELHWLPGCLYRKYTRKKH